MVRSQLRYLHQDRQATEGFRTAVSLHSHTLHSKESVAFVARIGRRVAMVDWLVQWQHRRLGSTASLEADLSAFYWTSPLSARQALDLERRQIIQKLGLDALVSISDHDSIQAPLQLQFSERNESVPVAVEWTVPFENTYFHLGIHNLDLKSAGETMARLDQYSRSPRPAVLTDLLFELHRRPEVLIVFNHPMWDQPWIGTERHVHLVNEFIERYRPCIHALEINGLRHWRENRRTLDLAKDFRLPVISGGDRHGREPNATLNLTNAATFAEFAAEVRVGHSEVLVMPQYLEPLQLRVIQTACEMLRDDPEHSLGWTRWGDRVFRVCRDGKARSLTQLCNGNEPRFVKNLVRITQLLASQRLRPALQFAFAGKQELA